MEPSAMFSSNESFDSDLFGFLGIRWPNHEMLYDSFFKCHPNGIHDTTQYGFLQEPAFDLSHMNFVNSMNQTRMMGQSAVISTSNDAREVSVNGKGTSYPWEGEKGRPPGIHTVRSSDVRRQRTPYPLPSSGAQLGGGASTSTSPPPGGVLQKWGIRTHRSTPSRNQQATADQVDEIMFLLDRSNFSEDSNNLVCPVRGCAHRQCNGRIQDFRRHLSTHLRKNGEIRCKGVLWENFLQDRHRFPKISMDDQPYTVPEEEGLWIGGCLKTFSRADALKRHLRKTSPCRRVSSSLTIPDSLKFV